MITQLGQQEGQQLKSTNQIALLLIQHFPRKGWIYQLLPIKEVKLTPVFCSSKNIHTSPTEQPAIPLEIPIKLHTFH